MDNKKTSKKVFRWIRSILFFLVVGILLSYIVIEAFFPSQTVKIYGFKPYVVLTQSMEPEINVDDVVVVTRPDTETLEEGDIITFLADINNDGVKNIVTHYVYSIEEDSSGDLEIRTRRHYEDPDDISPDPWLVTEEDVLGEYLFTVPNIGVIIRFLQSPFGLAAITVNALIIGAVVVLLKGEKKTPENKDDVQSSQ